MSSDFDELWAAIRQRLSFAEPPKSLVVDACQLRALALSDLQRLRLATVQVQIGALCSDNQLMWSGLGELASTPPESGEELLANFTELGIIGMPLHRWTIIRPICAHLLGGTTAAVAFVNSPSAETAAELVSSGLSPEPSLPANLQSELKVQVGWAALERYVEHRCPRAKEVMLLPSLRMRVGVEPGWWEQTLQRAVLSLAQGDEAHAVRLVEALSPSLMPSWKRGRVAYVLARFAVLAHSSLGDWLGLIGEDPPSHRDASSAVDRASMALTDMLLGRTRTTPQSLLDLGHWLESYSWMVFAGFCNTALRPSGRNYLGHLLLNLSESDLRSMHWGGRDAAFASHTLALEDPEDRLLLAARAAAVLQSPAVLKMLRDAIDLVSPKELFQLLRSNPEVWRQVQALAPQLSPARRSQIGRGGTYRAVIDGSNVMYGGLDSRHGGTPTYERLVQAEASLRAAGFDEVRVFVDSSCKWRLSPTDRGRLEKAKNSGKVSEVHYADPVILRTFAEETQGSELVTNDRFRASDLREEFPNLLNQTESARWRTFHLQEGRLEWDAPLDRRPR